MAQRLSDMNELLRIIFEPGENSVSSSPSGDSDGFSSCFISENDKESAEDDDIFYRARWGSKCNK